jgi:hypothetical protein
VGTSEEDNPSCLHVKRRRCMHDSLFDDRLEFSIGDWKPSIGHSGFCESVQIGSGRAKNVSAGD